MSLIISRRTGESFFMHLAHDADEEKLLQQLATTGIEIRIGEIKGLQAKVHITAPEAISILREELLTEGVEKVSKAERNIAD